MTEYDSGPDTRAHIRRVRDLLDQVTSNINERAMLHDESKLDEPEKSMFDEHTGKLRELTYGTPEYAAQLEAMGPALRHHYEHNRHHPEHYGDDGIYGMTLLDIIEMLADWKAAGERHEDGGDLRESIVKNKNRFGYDDAFANTLVKTAEELGWL